MALFTRQPFAEIGTPRLQALSSAKNRQNAIAPTPSSTPLKQLQPSTGKRRAAAVFEDDDAENVDPSTFLSPTKKSKTVDGFTKPAKFSLVPSSVQRPSQPITASSAIPSIRKALSSPNTTTSTPISHSRGSPKHKRIGLLSKRRASSSPFRRVDPPSFSQPTSAAPFSIDAALKGSIPDYTPKAAPVPSISTPNHVATLEDSMPNSWFFDIHEDTPEQEASNLMEHSAAVLDISSDDDAETKRLNDELERGKENIPPPDFLASQAQLAARAQSSIDALELAQGAPVEHSVKLPRLRKIAQDAMEEDREPLKDLPASEFYGEGLDATSCVTVDGIDRPSGLSKQFDFSVPTPEKKRAREEDDEEEPASKKADIEVFVDESVDLQREVACPDGPESVVEVANGESS